MATFEERLQDVEEDLRRLRNVIEVIHNAFNKRISELEDAKPTSVSNEAKERAADLSDE